MEDGIFFNALYDALYGLRQSEYNVLLACAKLCSYYDDKDLLTPGSSIVSNRGFRERVEALTGLSQVTIKCAMTSLCKKGLLLKNDRCRGEYYLNPEVIFKGDKQLHQKLLEMR